MTVPLHTLLDLLNQSFDRRSWHGPNLMGSLRGLTAEEASWRPAPERHNVWELVVHAAYWKYRVYRLLTEKPPRSFGLKGSNWFPRPADDAEADWESDLRHLRDWHDRLCSAVEGVDSDSLDSAPAKSEHTRWALISGAAAHDVYHAGQIQLIKRLMQR